MGQIWGRHVLSCEAFGSCWGLCMVFRQYIGLFHSLTRGIRLLTWAQRVLGSLRVQCSWVAISTLRSLEKMKVKVRCSVVSDSLWSHGRSPPGSSVHGILQARILEWVAISFSKGSSWPRDWTQVSCIAGRFFTLWATREAVDSLERSYSVPDCIEELPRC